MRILFSSYFSVISHYLQIVSVKWKVMGGVNGWNDDVLFFQKYFEILKKGHL